MSRLIIRRQQCSPAWATVLVFAILVGVAATACTEAATTTTVEETTTTAEQTSSTILVPTPQEQVQLQAQAAQQAVKDFRNDPQLCISTETPADLQAALTGVFGDRLEFIQPYESLLKPGSDSTFRCTALTVEGVERASEDTVCINAGVTWGPTSGRGTWFCFLWDGTAWVETDQPPGFTGEWAN
jgi:hypothetical protein